MKFKPGFIPIPIIAAIAALIVAASATIFGQVAQEGRPLETVGQTINLSATPGCRNANPVINLSWTAVGEENNYQISRQGGQGSWGAGSLLRTFTDFDVTGGTTYTYQVTAPSTGTSSNQVQATALTSDACGQLSQPQPTPSPSPQASPTPAPTPTPPAPGGANHPPSTVTITGPTQGAVGQTLTYSLRATDPDGDRINYRACWDQNGDGTTDQTAECRLNGPVASGSVVSVNASWPTAGSFLLLALATDGKDYSGWSWQTVVISSATGGLAPTPTPQPSPIPQPTPTPITPSPTPISTPIPTPTPPVGTSQKPGAFSLTSPANGTTSVSANPSFDWTDSARADHYWVYMGESGKAWYWTKQVTTSSTSWDQGNGWQTCPSCQSQDKPSNLSYYSGQWSWWVAAENSAGTTWADITKGPFTFTVGATATPSPSPSPIRPGIETIEIADTQVKDLVGLVCNRNPSPCTSFSNFQLTFRADEAETSVLINQPLRGTLSLIVSFGRSGEKSIWFDIRSASFNGTPIPANIVDKAKRTIEAQVNTLLGSIPGLRIEEISILPGKVRISGILGSLDFATFGQILAENLLVSSVNTLAPQISQPPSSSPTPPVGLETQPMQGGGGQEQVQPPGGSTAPSIPSTPQGPQNGLVGQTYTFTAQASDPNGDKIAMRFAFTLENGQDLISQNSAVSQSGCSQSCTLAVDHTFSNPGKYLVWAIAVNEKGGQWSTAWSNPSTISIDSTETPTNPPVSGDTQPPVITTVVDLQDGDTVAGEKWIRVQASDNVKVSHVGLFVDVVDPSFNNPHDTDWQPTENFYALQLRTTELADGTHTLYFYAYDEARNASRPFTITVNVLNKPPVPKNPAEVTVDDVKNYISQQVNDSPITIPAGFVGAGTHSFGQVLWGLAGCESSWNPREHGSYGEIGLFQYLPSTWASTPQGAAGQDINDPLAQVDATIGKLGAGAFGEWTCFRFNVYNRYWTQFTSSW